MAANAPRLVSLVAFVIPPVFGEVGPTWAAGLFTPRLPGEYKAVFKAGEIDRAHFAVWAAEGLAPTPFVAEHLRPGLTYEVTWSYGGVPVHRQQLALAEPSTAAVVSCDCPRLDTAASLWGHIAEDVVLHIGGNVYLGAERAAALRRPFDGQRVAALFRAAYARTFVRWALVHASRRHLCIRDDHETASGYYVGRYGSASREARVATTADREYAAHQLALLRHPPPPETSSFSRPLRSDTLLFMLSHRTPEGRFTLDLAREIARDAAPFANLLICTSGAPVPALTPNADRWRRLCGAGLWSNTDCSRLYATCGALIARGKRVLVVGSGIRFTVSCDVLVARSAGGAAEPEDGGAPEDDPPVAGLDPAAESAGPASLAGLAGLAGFSGGAPPADLRAGQPAGPGAPLAGVASFRVIIAGPISDHPTIIERVGARLLQGQGALGPFSIDTWTRVRRSFVRVDLRDLTPTIVYSGRTWPADPLALVPGALSLAGLLGPEPPRGHVAAPAEA